MSIRASPCGFVSGQSINYYATISHADVERQNPGLPAGNTSKSTVTALACRCNTTYSPITLQRKSYNTPVSPMDQKEPNAKDASHADKSNAVELPQLATSRNGHEDTKTSSLAESYRDDSTWSSNCMSDQHQRDATDSVLSLLRPATKKRGSQLREVQNASDEAGSSQIQFEGTYRTVPEARAYRHIHFWRRRRWSWSHFMLPSSSLRSTGRY